MVLLVLYVIFDLHYLTRDIFEQAVGKLDIHLVVFMRQNANNSVTETKTYKGALSYMYVNQLLKLFACLSCYCTPFNLWKKDTTFDSDADLNECHDLNITEIISKPKESANKHTIKYVNIP